MAFKDHFSRQSTGYGLYRPHYPAELFACLADLCRRHDLAWDCGCGTGQAAHGLSQHFKSVIATDASAAQIDKAVPADRVEYQVAPAEQSGLASASVDLVLVAQALHWFDFEAFYREVRRVCRADAVLAAVTYGLMRVNPEIDQIIDHLYVDLLGGDWPAERQHVDNGYQSIPFPFPRLADQNITMSAEWDFDHCFGYLETWSAVQRYRQRTGHCPLAEVADPLLAAWGDREQVRQLSWPISLLLGQVSSSAVDPVGLNG